MFTLLSKIHRPLAWLACAMTALLCAAPAHAVVTHTINSNSDVELFIQAIRTPDARVTIAGNVNLDVSGRQDLYIARGVQIIGDQSVYPAGPRIFSSNPQPGDASYLFLVGDEWLGTSDNVRISGVRFDGGAGDEFSNKVGISIRSSINVEIDHCDFRGWGRAAIEVLDPTGNRITLANASTVRVHDNYIHDNQEPGGYGVVTGKGAYALIEQNVFYSNRHSISGDGSDGSGYLVYRNLELANTGHNRDEQQIDMHGQLNCGDAHANCGPAGEYMDIRYNTVQHVLGTSFHLRGRPWIRADVAYNVFALPKSLALKQNNGDNLYEWDNAFGLNTYGEEKYCDFDADGIVDRFMATGATWWYRSSLVGRWTYLNQSVERAYNLSLRDFTGDGRCDVIANGVVFQSGMSAMRGTDVLWRQSNGLQPLTWQLATDGNVYRTRFSPLAIQQSDRVLGTGDFDGDGDSDVLVSSSSGQVHRVLMEDGSGVRDKPVSWIGIAFAGTGDFDGDGTDDVLWRFPDGRLHIWFSGMNGRWAWVSWGNQGGALESAWQIKGVADFNVDGRADILFRHTNGSLAVWLMNGGSWTGDLHPATITSSPMAWEISGVGDFDGDRRPDILWRSFLDRSPSRKPSEPAACSLPTVTSQGARSRVSGRSRESLTSTPTARPTSSGTT